MYLILSNSLGNKVALADGDNFAVLCDIAQNFEASISRVAKAMVVATHYYPQHKVFKSELVRGNESFVLYITQNLPENCSNAILDVLL
jgi:hypothetical protein